MRGTIKTWLCMATLVGALTVTGCQVTDTATAPPTQDVAPTTEAVETAPPVEEPVAPPVEEPVAPPVEEPAHETLPSTSLLSAIEALPVAEEAYADEYDRALFNHWVSMDGCDTRFVVLVRDGQNVTTDGCKFTGGEWFSAYDQVTSNDPKTFDIDHMVPLKEAWRSGAYAWDSGTREAYANDLGYRYSLVAVTASSNRSKSDSDPSDWFQVANECEYVSQWTAVKTRWNLTVNQKEKDKLVSVAQGCGDFAFEMPAKAGAPAAAPAAPAPVAPAPEETAAPAPAPAPAGATDPQFSSCKEAKANGKGPYVKGQHPEYDWYRDGDGDGTVCE